jgi:hypothetical protein
MCIQLIAYGGSDEVAAIGIKAFLDQKIDLPKVDSPEVDRDFFRIAILLT